MEVKPKKILDNFCGDVFVEKGQRPVFKHVVQKYKRNYHPSNASRGSYDASNLRSRPVRTGSNFWEVMTAEDYRH